MAGSLPGVSNFTVDLFIFTLKAPASCFIIMPLTSTVALSLHFSHLVLSSMSPKTIFAVQSMLGLKWEDHGQPKSTLSLPRLVTKKVCNFSFPPILTLRMVYHVMIPTQFSLLSTLKTLWGFSSSFVLMSHHLMVW